MVSIVYSPEGEQTIQQLLRMIRSFLNFDRAALWFLDEKNQRVQGSFGTDRNLQTTDERHWHFPLDPESQDPLVQILLGKIQPYFLIQDYQTHPYASLNPSMKGVKAHAIVPFKVEGKIVGAITVDNLVSQRPISEEDVEKLLFFAEHIGLIVHNFWLIRDLRIKNEELKRLWEVIQAITTLQDLPGILEMVCETIVQISDGECSLLALVDEETGRIQGVAGYNTPRDPSVMVSESLDSSDEADVFADIIRNPRLLYAEDYPPLLEHPRWAEYRLANSWSVFIPIQLGDQAIGVGVIKRPKEKGPFSQEEIEMIQTFLEQSAIAIHNSKLYQKTLQLALTDSLTGLYTHRYFYEEIERLIAMAKRYNQALTLIMLDIDNFKQINDQYGHLVGDQVLQLVAEILQKNVRASDFAARYGGEEFVLVLNRTTAQQAYSVAKRILQNLVVETQNRHLPTTTISAGIADFPHRAQDPLSLIRSADTALLQAKRLGKNRVCIADLNAKGMNTYLNGKEMDS